MNYKLWMHEVFERRFLQVDEKYGVALELFLPEQLLHLDQGQISYVLEQLARLTFDVQLAQAMTFIMEGTLARKRLPRSVTPSRSTRNDENSNVRWASWTAASAWGVVLKSSG
jgi:hypothetical protein